MLTYSSVALNVHYNDLLNAYLTDETRHDFPSAPASAIVSRQCEQAHSESASEKSPIFRNFVSKTKDVSGLNKAIKQQNKLFRFSLDTEFCSILPKKCVYTPF